MTEQRNDGGPAFPFATVDGHLCIGMSLRDYAAIHSTQPGCAEICKCAGVRFDGFKVYLTEYDANGVKFDDWWRSLSLERMCELSAMVRYAQADAMLKVRQP